MMELYTKCSICGNNEIAYKSVPLACGNMVCTNCYYKHTDEGHEYHRTLEDVQNKINNDKNHKLKRLHMIAYVRKLAFVNGDKKEWMNHFSMFEKQLAIDRFKKLREDLNQEDEKELFRLVKEEAKGYFEKFLPWQELEKVRLNFGYNNYDYEKLCGLGV